MNSTIDYQMFKAQYVNFRSQFEDTFNTKVFAENIVYHDKKLKLSDEGNFEKIHADLTVLETKKSKEISKRTSIM